MIRIRWSISEGLETLPTRSKGKLDSPGWNRCLYLACPVQLQVLGDLKAVSAGANTSVMKALSSSIIAQFVFGCLNVPPKTQNPTDCLLSREYSGMKQEGTRPSTEPLGRFPGEKSSHGLSLA